MQYSVTGNLISHQSASFTSKGTNVSFGIKSDQDQLPNPAELLLGAFAACCLKNIERFSEMLHFDYDQAQIEVTGERQENPTKIISIHYVISIKSNDENLKVDLLHKNIQKFGTIYNTLKETCVVSGELTQL